MKQPAITAKHLITALVIYCLGVALVFQGTLASMVAIWIRSETFTHGFLIAPISLWLTWRIRDRFHADLVQPAPWALVLVLGFGLIWLVANLVDVLVVQQLAFVSILISGIWAIAGTALVRRFMFPLGYLFLAVPMGEGLIPPLMEITADTTEVLVRATGIPIYREGMYLYLPTGTWSVIEACSGIRYLIASVALGLCYAHLTYHSWRRQTAFMALAFILPIIANSARAYILVMVGHLTDMRYGIGADHLLFGWVFFGVVLLLMFWIGNFWQEDEQATVAQPQTSDTVQGSQRLSPVLVTALAIVGAGVWAAVATTINSDDVDIPALALTSPTANAGWQAIGAENWEWRPAQPGADRELDVLYRYGTQTEATVVGLHLRQYLQQRQDVELVNSIQTVRPDRALWRLMSQQRLTIALDSGQTIELDESRVVSPRNNLLIWYWYHIDDRNLANPYLVKILEAKQQLFEGRRRGTRMFIATPTGSDNEQARQVLTQFLNDHMADIEATVDAGIGIAAPDVPHNHHTHK